MLEVYPELSSPGISISDNSELGMACWHFLNETRENDPVLIFLNELDTLPAVILINELVIYVITILAWLNFQSNF
jgi:hypothetical protein